MGSEMVIRDRHGDDWLMFGKASAHASGSGPTEAPDALYTAVDQLGISMRAVAAEPEGHVDRAASTTMAAARKDEGRQQFGEDDAEVWCWQAMTQLRTCQRST